MKLIVGIMLLYFSVLTLYAFIANLFEILFVIPTRFNHSHRSYYFGSLDCLVALVIFVSLSTLMWIALRLIRLGNQENVRADSNKY